MKKPIAFLILQGGLLFATAKATNGGDHTAGPVFNCSGTHRRSCHDIWIGQHIDHESGSDVGEVCLHVEQKRQEINDTSEHNYPEEPTLVLSYTTNSNWSIHESYVWLGTSLADMPRLHSQNRGPPSLQEFPVVDWDINGENQYEVQLRLLQDDSALRIGCATSNDKSIRYYLALHPVILQDNQQQEMNHSFQHQKSTKIPAYNQDAKNTTRSWLRSSSKMPVDNLQSTVHQLEKRKGLWWMEFSFDLDCPQPATLSAKNGTVAINSFHEEEEHQQVKTAITPVLTNVQHERRLFSLQPRQQSNETCAMISDSISEEDTNTLVTEDLLYQFHIANELALSVSFKPKILSKVDYYRTIYERFDAFDDERNDAAIIAKVDQTCYAVFRGTVEYNDADVAQNFVPGYRRVPDTDCYVRRGYYDAYFTSYKEEFETELRHCVDSCQGEDGTGEPCQVILSGASQGAANSIVASIALFEEYDPYVLSFALPRVFLPTSPFDDDLECKSVNRERQYHFLLTDSLLKVYDPVPYYPAYFTKYEGREILFDGEGNFNDQGLSTSENDKYHQKRSPSSIVIHTRWNYYVKAKQAYENACLPIPVRGWRDGHWCSDDYNCQSTSYCARKSKLCSPRAAAGQPCDSDGACLSGSCSSDEEICLTEPKSLTVNGESCQGGDDCASGRCDGIWGFSTCQARLESGDDCNEHSDCLSMHCVGFLHGKCL